MNVNGLINMVLRRLMRQGINKGISHVARGGKHPQDMSPQERQKAKRGVKTAGQAQRSMRMFRRLF